MLALPTGAATHVFDLSGHSAVAPLPRTIEEIRIECAPGATRHVDWITIQDGLLPFPPARDLDVEWSDSQQGGGGYVTDMTLSCSSRKWKTGFTEM